MYLGLFWSHELSRFPKIAHFQLSDAGLTSKWVRISPAVFWLHQNQSSYVIRRCATSRNVAEKFADYAHTHTILRMEAARGLNMNKWLIWREFYSPLHARICLNKNGRKFLFFNPKWGWSNTELNSLLKAHMGLQFLLLGS